MKHFNVSQQKWATFLTVSFFFLILIYDHVVFEKLRDVIVFEIKFYKSHRIDFYRPGYMCSLSLYIYIYMHSYHNCATQSDIFSMFMKYFKFNSSLVGNHNEKK